MAKPLQTGNSRELPLGPLWGEKSSHDEHVFFSERPTLTERFMAANVFYLLPPGVPLLDIG